MTGVRGRATAAMVSAGLLVALLLAAFAIPTPYTVYSPGPTVNLLAKSEKTKNSNGGYVVRVGDGTKVYRDDGALRLLTVVPTSADAHVPLAEAMLAWVLPSEAVYRHDDIYRPTDTTDSVKAQNNAMMTSSQDTAVAAALRALDYKVPEEIQVASVQREGPADGALEARDRLVSVQGTKVTSIDQAVRLVRALEPGTTARIGVVRRGEPLTVKVKTVPSQANAKQSALLVSLGIGFDFPVEVNLRVPDSIGGPSAGMMFALAIYDTLTPGSMTGDGDVAGTGEIDEAGKVGAIGGIQQKLVGAQRAGARLFLAPADNCDEVRGGPYDADKMRVTKVSTLDDAIAAVDAWRKNHDAKLPQC